MLSIAGVLDLIWGIGAVSDSKFFVADQEHIISSLKRDLLVEQRGDSADLALGDPQPEALDELINPPGRNAAHIGLLDDRHQRLLRALAGLQERRK